MQGRNDQFSNWRAARSFDDLLALGRRFVTGEIQSFPGWGAAATDEESDDLEVALLAAHDLGMLTVASQPGRPFGPGHDGYAWGARAFVGGWMRPEPLGELAQAAHARGLLALAEGAHPERNAEGAFPDTAVGLRDGAAYLVLGCGARDQELDIFRDALHDDAFSELRSCAILWVVDPVWGRRSALPAFLEGAAR